MKAEGAGEAGACQEIGKARQAAAGRHSRWKREGGTTTVYAGVCGTEGNSGGVGSAAVREVVEGVRCIEMQRPG